MVKVLNETSIVNLCVFHLKDGIHSIILDGRNLKERDSFSFSLTNDETYDIIFKKWAEWVEKYNVSKGIHGAPIAVVWDVEDLDTVKTLCEKNKVWDSKMDIPRLFNPIAKFILSDHMWFWTRTIPDINNVEFNQILEYMGVENLLQNSPVEWMAKIAARLLNMGKNMTAMNQSTGKRRLDMKDCFKC